jgi:hypothetical protein
MTKPTTRRELTVPLWSLGLIAAFFAVSCVSLWMYVILTRPTAPRVTASPMFVVVASTSAAAATATPASPSTKSPTSSALTPTVPPNLNSGSINLGVFVQVTGTGGVPLNLRQAPSLKSDIAYRAIENQVFKVENGPTIADGFTWWLLVDLVDKTRTGWAVENYLQPTSR